MRASTNAGAVLRAALDFPRRRPSAALLERDRPARPDGRAPEAASLGGPRIEQARAHAMRIVDSVDAVARRLPRAGTSRRSCDWSAPSARADRDPSPPRLPARLGPRLRHAPCRPPLPSSSCCAAGACRPPPGWPSKLEVSVRTVYRDVADLQGQGVPIEGEAGVGYRLRRRLRPAAADVHHARGPGAGRRRPAGAEPARSLAGAGRRGRAGQDHRRAAAGGARRRRGAAAVRRALGHRPRQRRAPGPAARRGLDAPAHPLRLRGRAGRRHRRASRGRWAATTGNRSGRWPPGASTARRSAASASTACARWTCWTTSSATSRAARCRTSCAT